MCSGAVRKEGWRRSGSGQAIVITGLAMLVIMAAAGLAVDLGYLRYIQRQAQNAADSAAVAATVELLNGDYVTAGRTDAAANGFTNGVNNVTVTVNYPPTSGNYANQTNFVEVIINATVPTFFMKAVGYSTETVSARAVGHYWTGANCVYALAPTADGAIQTNGTISMGLQCGMVDDSSAGDALLMNGSSGSISATSIMITGGYSTSGTLSLTPATSVPPEPDPLAYLSEPTVPSCTYSPEQHYGGSATLTRGVYCGGISIDGSGIVTFSPGTYVINGGELNIGGSSTIIGNNVMFYITGGADVKIAGGTTVNLTARTTGTYAGILFFQDRTDSSAASFDGGNSLNLTGALYFPDAPVEFAGNNSASAYTILIAYTILFDGNSTFNDNYASLTNGSPIKTATLAE